MRILNQSAQEIEQFIHEIFLPLLFGNGQHKELGRTLLTYINLNRSANKIAEEFHIHINTFYQRLNKFENLLAIDLNDSEDALKIQLACRLKNSQVGLMGK